METALDIRLLLIEPPYQINKLRIHKTHLYKAKTQARLEETTLPSDTVEVRAVVFRASALKNPVTHEYDPEKVDQAMRCVRTIVEVKEEESPSPSPSPPPESANNIEPIRTPCKLCIGREMKRLTRGPQTPKAKPKAKSKVTNGHHLDQVDSGGANSQQSGKIESEEITRASSRMVTMSAKGQELVEWQPAPSKNTDSAAQLMRAAPAPVPPSDEDDEDLGAEGKKKKKLPPPPVDEDTIAVDMALRVCCYCRHKNENEGYW